MIRPNRQGLDKNTHAMPIQQCGSNRTAVPLPGCQHSLRSFGTQPASITLRSVVLVPTHRETAGRQNVTLKRVLIHIRRATRSSEIYSENMNQTYSLTLRDLDFTTGSDVHRNLVLSSHVTLSGCRVDIKHRPLRM